MCQINRLPPRNIVRPSRRPPPIISRPPRTYTHDHRRGIVSLHCCFYSAYGITRRHTAKMSVELLYTATTALSVRPMSVVYAGTARLWCMPIPLVYGVCQSIPSLADNQCTHYAFFIMHCLSTVFDKLYTEHIQRIYIRYTKDNTIFILLL